jgi:hypothetical protein
MRGIAGLGRRVGWQGVEQDEELRGGIGRESPVGHSAEATQVMLLAIVTGVNWLGEACAESQHARQRQQTSDVVLRVVAL